MLWNFYLSGISAGIDLALYFVKKMIGKPEADAIAERLEYDWKDEEYDECAGRLFTGGPDDHPILSFPRNFWTLLILSIPFDIRIHEISGV